MIFANGEINWIPVLLATLYIVPAIVASTRGYTMLAIAWFVQALIGALVRILWLPDTFNSPIFTKIRKQRKSVLLLDKISLYLNIANLLRLQRNSVTTLSRQFILITVFLILLKTAQIKLLPTGTDKESDYYSQFIDAIWLGSGVVLVLYWMMTSLK